MTQEYPEYTESDVPDGTEPPMSDKMPTEEGDAGVPDPEPFEED